MRRSQSSGRVDGGNLSHVDLDCKEALQKLLRPSYYGIINPWMGSASTRQKQDMILLKKRMEEADQPGKNPYFMADVGKIQITSNPWGRERESNVIPVTGDRIQADLLRNQSGAEQRDVRREKERRYMARYHEIPSTSSVADFFQLSQTPVLEHPTMKVLTDRVRGKLKHWQVLGPEQNPHEAAEMMRGLQTLAAACDRLPSYAEHSATSSKKVHERLFGYSQVVPRGNRTLKEVPKLRRAPLSSSAPILLRPLMDPSELELISRPGGTVCKLKDCEPLQRMKNIARSSQSQVQMSMGPTDWSTTSRDMAKDYS